MKLIPITLLSILVFVILIHDHWTFLTQPERGHLLSLSYKALSLVMVVLYLAVIGALGWFVLTWHGLVGSG